MEADNYLDRLVSEGKATKQGNVYCVRPHHQETLDASDFDRLFALGVQPAPQLIPKEQEAAWEDLSQFETEFDPVNRPEHYNSHPSGVECVTITEHMTCMIGCAIKYLWRHGMKAGADADQDLRKAIWCIERERTRLAAMKDPKHGK